MCTHRDFVGQCGARFPGRSRASGKTGACAKGETPFGIPGAWDARVHRAWLIANGVSSGVDRFRLRRLDSKSDAISDAPLLVWSIGSITQSGASPILFVLPRGRGPSNATYSKYLNYMRARWTHRQIIDCSQLAIIDKRK